MHIKLPRRALAGVLALLVAGCSDDAPPRNYEPISFSYLTPLQLKVGSIDLDDNWAPASLVPDISTLSPLQPIEALRRMAQDRLVAVGNGGHAVFRIEDAGINRIGDQLQGHFGVELDIYTSGNTRTAYAEARVARASLIIGSGIEALRGALYDLTRQMMTDMNVEFEYQIRRSLHEWLQDAPMGGPAVPAPVTQQPLDAPPTLNGAAPIPPTPLQPLPSQLPPPTVTQPQMSPPPGVLGTIPQSLLPPVAPPAPAPTGLQKL